MVKKFIGLLILITPSLIALADAIRLPKMAFKVGTKAAWIALLVAGMVIGTIIPQAAFLIPMIYLIVVRLRERFGPV